MRRIETEPGAEVYYAPGRDWLDHSDPDRCRVEVVRVGLGSTARIRYPGSTGEGWPVSLTVLRGPWEPTAARVREHQARRDAKQAAAQEQADRLRLMAEDLANQLDRLAGIEGVRVDTTSPARPHLVMGLAAARRLVALFDHTPAAEG